MNTLQTHAKPQPAITPTPAPASLLQRKCACGNHSPGGGECAECRKEEAQLRRTAVNAEPLQTVPPIVHEVLRSPGQPLAPDARAFFEPRFGRDFSSVRVHADPRAAESANAVGARAYASGRHVVFGAKQYHTETGEGRRLLAHELAHVAQQSDLSDSLAPTSISEPSHPAEAAADAAAARAFGGRFESELRQGRNSLVRQMPGVFPSGQRSIHPRRLDDSPAGERAATMAPPPARSSRREESAEPSGSLEEIRPAPPDRVHAITISCADMRMRLETQTTNYYYRMENCRLPMGDYTPGVTISDNDFYLEFGDAVGSPHRLLRYRVEPGQTNPATLLADQSSVDVHVIERLAAPRSREERTPESRPPSAPECVARLRDRELIPRDSYSRRLFEPIIVPPTRIWGHRIPLGQFGWLEVEAKASADVSGQFNASYGPGMLTDICLTRLTDASQASAPIYHPLLGPGSHADSSVYGIGGRARFALPAQAQVTVRATGRLRIAGEHLGLYEIAAAEGSLTASGVATLSGSIDASVDILARFARDSATLQHPIFPLSVTIEHSSLQGLDLAAAIGLRGRAALSFRLDGGAAFSVLGQDIWSQNWNLLNFNAGIGWQGGLVYSPNPGLHWDLGEFGALSEGGADADGVAAPESLDDVVLHEDAADFNGEALLPNLFEEQESSIDMPEGLSEDDALPFTWCKPAELYVGEVDLPNAESPPSIGKYDGPTDVSYYVRGRLQNAEIGVADWPSVGRTFQYYPYDTGNRDTPQQGRFRTLLSRLGFPMGRAAGLDAEHVLDAKLFGLGYDRFDNLWPATNREQQRAGGAHKRQIQAYESSRDGNVAGRHFVIVDVKHPDDTPPP